jgi:hypothetical protein
MEFVEALVAHLISGGIGVALAPGLVSGDTCVQHNYRRDTPANIVLVRQSGGLAFPHAAKELQTIQVLVDAPSISGARGKAREVHDALHELLMYTFSGGHHAMFIRATQLPQAIPVLSALGLKERFLFSVNFQALLILQGAT